MSCDADQLEAKIQFWRAFVGDWEKEQGKPADQRVMELLDDLEEHLRSLTNSGSLLGPKDTKK